MDGVAVAQVREVASVVALALLGLLCLDFAAEAAVKEQERSRAEAAALQALEAANLAREIAAGAEWAAVEAASNRDSVCACEWSMVQADPDYHKLMDKVIVRCRTGDDCTVRYAWAGMKP